MAPRSPHAGYDSRRRERDREYDRDFDRRDYRDRDDRRRYDDDEYRSRRREDGYRDRDGYRSRRRTPSPVSPRPRRSDMDRRRSRSPAEIRVRNRKDRDERGGERRSRFGDRNDRTNGERDREPRAEEPHPHNTASELPTKTEPNDDDAPVSRKARMKALQERLAAELAAEDENRNKRLQLKSQSSEQATNGASKASATPQTASTNGVIVKPGFKSIAASGNSTSSSNTLAKSSSQHSASNILKKPLKMNATDAATGPKKRNAEIFAHEEVKRRKIEQLPDIPTDDAADGINEDEDEAEPAPTTAEAKAAAEEDGIDPLDAYMAELDQQMAAESTTAIGEVIENADMVAGDDDDAGKSTITDQINEIKGMKKKKEVRVVNWKKETLSPLQKDFYRESEAVKALTKAEVSKILATDNIRIRGNNPLKPILRWENASFPRNIMSVIEQDLKFDAPTPIQAVALPTLMSGRDAIAIAQTGSGKTLAYILPMLRHIQAQPTPSKVDAKAPAALILVPTRELATQVHTNARPFTKKLGLRMVAVYGGTSVTEQLSLIKVGVDIIISTPGRAIDFLEYDRLDLRRVTFFVLDEADRMLDMGFEPQISKISQNIRPDRQTCCFSATFNRKMDSIARNYLHNPIEIIVEGRSTIPPKVSVEVRVIPEKEKFHNVLQILGDFALQDDDPRTLIFVHQQKTADDLLDKLLKAGYPCNSIYGSKDQQDRTDAISDFQNGVVPVLIGTSVAARGLDIEDLKLVIQYDPADHMEDNIHRIGRTGRAGKPGRAVCFISESQANCAGPLAKALKLSKREVPPELQKLADDFEQEVQSGKAQRAHTGFGGRGLERLDQEHDAERRHARKEAGVDEEVKEFNATSDDEDDAFTKAIWEKATGSKAPEARQEAPQLGSEAQARIDQFDNIKFDIKKREVPAPIKKTSGPPGSANPLSRAQQKAAEISQRMSSRNTIRAGQSLDNKGPDAGAFHATLEINGFGQRARWQATNRSNIAKLLEKGNCSITNKGRYYPAGTEPGPNDLPKMYILVEGETESIVSEVMKDLIGLLKKGEMEEQAARPQASATARYNPLGN